MRQSYIIAAIVALVLALWVASSWLLPGGSADAPETDARGSDDAPFAVRVTTFEADAYEQRIEISGRTEAVRAVELKAQADGQVIATPVEKGERIEAGALLCRLAANEREANLEEARALASQRELEYKAAEELGERGHRSATQIAAAKAQLEAARAQVRQMEVALENTRIEAPFAALVEDRPAKVGDYLQRGDICARLIDEQPFLVVGEVSEDQIDLLTPGGEAEILLANGRTLNGRIRFIAGTATERTRTFPIEIAVPNEDRSLREGLTAEIRVPVATRQAHLLPASVLVLDDAGRLGVRTVNDEEIVAFHPVRILADSGDGLWVAGLPETLRIITVGQGFVRAGERVRAVETAAEATS